MPLLVNTYRSIADNTSRIHNAYTDVSRMICSLTDFQGKKSLLRQLNQLKEFGLELVRIAPTFDYSSEVQGNGFRTMIEIGLQFMRNGAKELKSGNTDFLHEYVKVCDNISRMIPYVKQVQAACKEAGALECSSPELTAQLFHDYIRSEEYLLRLFNRTALFDLGPLGSLCLNLLFWVRAIASAPNVSGLIKCIFDRDYRDSLLLIRARKSTVSSIHRITRSDTAKYVMRHVYPFVMNGWQPRIRQDFTIKRQSSFKIQLDKDLSPHLIQKDPIDHHENGVQHLQCRLIRSEDECQTLMINIHGGAFTICDLYTNDVFLRYWARKISGLAVVGVEYSLLPHSQFPVQVQECLDALLFFCNPKNRKAIIRRIGFYPDQVMLSGDSAGACLVMASMIALNEVKKKFNLDIQMPKSAFLFYPWLSVHPDIRPSLFVSSMTTLLHTMGFYQVMRCYIPITQSNAETTADKDVNDNKMQTQVAQATSGAISSWPVISHVFKLVTYLFSTDTSIPAAPWKPYRASPSSLVQQINSSANLSKHPFVSPLFYDDFQSLRDVKLYIAACSHDSLLDEAVLMARKWQGPVVLDVMNNLQHGFLHLMMFTENSRKAIDLFAKRITDWM
jgi:acetyl esterase/lipase